jgi:hypothetical protein
LVQPSSDAAAQPVSDPDFALTMRKADPLIVRAIKDSALFEPMGARELVRVQAEIVKLESELKHDQAVLAKEKK